VRRFNVIHPYRAAGLVLAALLVVLSPAAARPAEESVEDLLFDLQIVLLAGQKADFEVARPVLGECPDNLVKGGLVKADVHGETNNVIT